MLSVLLLFLIPLGIGIPAGALLARRSGIGWPLMTLLYLVSDVILACLFEPLLRLVIAAGRTRPALARATEAVRRSMERTANFFGGAGAGPFMLVMIAFGVDPMTGRTAAAAAGHGFLAGWAIAIAGDMLYFLVTAAATLKLNALLGDSTRTTIVVLVVMSAAPLLLRWAKSAFSRRGAAA
jgi:hypothetical protein